MKVFKGSFMILCVLPGLNAFTTFRNSSTLVANAVNSIADFFSANCIYFISSSRSDIANQRLGLSFAYDFGKSIAFSNFSEYYNLMKNFGKEQCQVPLRVIFQLSETTIAKDFEDFNWFYKNYWDKIHSGVWIIFTKSFEDKFIADFFRQIFLSFDIKIMVAWIHNDMIHLKEVYQVSPSTALRQHYFGNYTFKTGLTSQKYLYYSRRTDLEGLKLKVAYIEENLPFTVMQSIGGENRLGGYFGEIWHALEDLLNISTIYVKVNLTRGKRAEQNSWLQIMEMLKQKKIDAGLADFIQSTSRIDNLDFSYPLFISNFQVFYKTSPRRPRLYGHFIPFGNDIWLSLLIWMVINPLCHFCFTRILKLFLKKTGKISSMSTSIFMTFGGLCGKGWSNCSKFTSCRMLFLLTYILATVVIPSYTASLTRYLTSKPLQVIIRDLNDLYGLGNHKLVVVDGSYEYYFFNFSKNFENLRKVGGQITMNEMLPKSHKEALLLTCTEKNIAVFTATSTLIWELDKVENAELKSTCSLSKMVQHAGKMINGIIYPKNSRFRRLIDYHLRNLQNTGIIDRLQKKYWKNEKSLRRKRWESVTLKNSSAVFCIILCGFIFSLVIVILEQIIQYRIRRRAKKKDIWACIWKKCSK